MKRGLFFFALIFLILLNAGIKSADITGDTITGESITGEVTQSVGINITVTADSINPDINITNPTQNNTNSTDSGLDINFTVSDANLDECWYSNDTYSVNRSTGCGTNLTNITWSNALHNLTIYVNDTFGNENSSSISFNISSEDEETPADEVSEPSGGSTIKGFSLDKEKIKITLKQGETKKRFITIKNIGDTTINIELETDLQFIKINETGFNLKAEETKIISLDFKAEENTIPDLYVGKIIVKGNVKKEILIAIEIESKKPLFDVKLEIPEQFMNVDAGEDITANIYIISLINLGKIDVNINYIIKDEKGNEIVKESETRELETGINFTKTLKIPEDAKPGTYLYYVRVTYNNEVAGASEWFSIGKLLLAPPLEKKNETLKVIIFILIILIIFIIILLAILISSKKFKKHSKSKIKNKNP